MNNSFATYVAHTKEVLEPLFKQPYCEAASLCSADLDCYLYGPLARFVDTGGKRVRPALVLLGCEVCGGKTEKAIPAALATEQFQAAALIHDDIADASLTRHGAPALYVQEGVGLAINCGDGALVESFASIIRAKELNESTKQLLLDELVRMMQRTLEGQALDLGWVRDEVVDLSPEAYYEMASLKTAHYSAASPLVMGALVSGASKDQIDALRAFGLSAGLAFQIHDDLMNLVGDAKAQGKDFRSDLVEGKRTLVACYALSHASAKEQDELARLLFSHTTNEAELDRIVRIFEETGALAYAEEQEDVFCKNALVALSEASFPNKEALALLEDMPVYFVNRKS